MFFSVRDLELSKARFDVRIEPGRIEFLDPKLRQVEPVKAQGEVELVSHSLGEIRVQGLYLAPMEAECDRCLEWAPLLVEETLDLVYRPADQAADVEEDKINESEAEIAFYEGEGIELEEVLREQILLALPPKRVCREECRGLCPVCGQNRNQQDCDCERKPVDERWSALKELK